MDRVTSPALCYQSFELRFAIRRRTMNPPACYERWLVQREFLNIEPARRCECKRRSGRNAEHGRRSTRFSDQRFYVFDLALDRIGHRVATLTSTAAVVAEHGEVRRQQWSQF